MDWRRLERDLMEIRRDLHRYPEAAWTEFRTSSLVAERLERLGYRPVVEGTARHESLDTKPPCVGCAACARFPVKDALARTVCI